jgi:hypothetical protein
MEVLDRVDEMDDPLLPRDAADKQHERRVRVDAELREHGRVRRRPVLLQVNPVVDDADAFGRHAVEGLHVAAHRGRHGDDAIGVLVGGALDPRGGVIRRPELLDLPRPVWLERVRRQHQRDALERLHQASGEMRVPRVAVHHVGGGDRAAHHQIEQERGEELGVARVLRGQRRRRFDPGH